MVGRAGRPVPGLPRRACPRDGPLSTPALTARLRELLGAGFVSPPAWRGDRRFFSRRSGDQEHAVVVVAEGDDERVLLDPMQIDPEGTTTLDSWQPSKEGDLVAYQVSTGGTEESVLRVLDVATGEVVDGPIDRARYSPVAWLPGGEAFFYVRRLAPELLPDRRGPVPPPRLAAPARHAAPSRTSRCSATGSTTPTTTASRSRATGAG